jgi:hypothetical protein
MTKEELERLKGQILTKIAIGDFVILGIIMGKPQETARTRFRRGKKDAILAMQKIVENRENFIKRNKK